jgi:hypothetical protein
MTEEVNAPQGAEQAEAPQLSLQDISTMVQVIDICSKRGGFEGPELEMVGGVRNRIVKFLEAAAPPQGGEGEAAAGEDLPEEVEGELA